MLTTCKVCGTHFECEGGFEPAPEGCPSCSSRRTPLDSVAALLTDRDNVKALNAELLAAARKVLAGLNARIDQARADGTPVPVFTGIADLHAAIARCE
jgi:hypothetical protein